MLMQPGDSTQSDENNAPGSALPMPDEVPAGTAGWSYEAIDETAPAPPQAVSPNETVTWTASEYIAHQKTTNWYIALGVGTALVTMAIFFLTGHSILSTGVVFLICVAIGVFAARKPGAVEYTLSIDGVHIGQKIYPYHNFKSFAVVEEGGVNSIWLRPLRRFLPTVNMYFGPEDEDRIVGMLDNFLPREDRDRDTLDRISHRFRF
jgi:hypothetical protein